MRTLAKFSVAAALAACGGGDTSAPDAAPAPGRVAMVFEVTNGVRQSPNLADPLIGTIYGQVFLSRDVTLTGPLDGAMEFGYVEVAGVDLTVAVTAGAWASDDLPPDDYTFLGFYDLDGNGGTDQSPDPGDPVTIPGTDQFTIEPNQGAPIQLTANFDFVYN